MWHKTDRVLLWIWLSAVLCSLSLTVASCSGTSATQPSDRPVPATIRDGIQGLSLPGVDSVTAQQLKAELLRVLEQNGTARAASTPPTTVLNTVTDLVAEDDGSGGANLSWGYRCVGDYDQNGEVNAADLTEVGRYFGATNGSPVWESAWVADGDSNGEVNVSDVTPIGVHFNNQVAGYRIFRSMDEEDCPASVDAPNGAGTEEAGQVLMPGTSVSPVGQIRFSANAPDHTAGMYYWVRPFDTAGVLGARSLEVQLGEPDAPWTHTWGLSKWDTFNDVAVDAAGNIYAIGSHVDPAEPGTKFKMLLVKYDPGGKSLYSRTWSLLGNYTAGISIEVDAAGNLVVLGETEPLDSIAPQLVVQKLNQQGELIWSHLIGGDDVENAEDLLVAGTDIYFAGRSRSFSDLAEVLAGKLDASGNLLWSRRWVGSGLGDCRSGRLGFRDAMLGDTLYLATCTPQAAGHYALVLLRYTPEGALVDTHQMSLPNGVDVLPQAIEVSYNKFTFETTVYLLSSWLGSIEQVYVCALDGLFEPVYGSLWTLPAGLLPTGMTLDAQGGITVAGFGNGLSAGTSLAYYCRFDRITGLPLAAGYLGTDHDYTSFHGVASYRGGLLLWGFAPNAAGDWNTVVGTSASTDLNWSVFDYSEAPAGLIPEPQPGIAGTVETAVIDTGAGEQDALVVYRELPE